MIWQLAAIVPHWYGFKGSIFLGARAEAVAAACELARAFGDPVRIRRVQPAARVQP